MKKTIMVAMVLFAVVLVSAFALGAAYTGEPVTLDGTLVENTGTPFTALKTDAGVWSLMLPGMYGYDIPVKDGDKLTVTGFEVPGPARGLANDMRYLMVQKIVVGNKEYVLPQGNDYSGMMGQYGRTGQYGMMGQYGRTGQYGMMGQYGRTGQYGMMGQSGMWGNGGPCGNGDWDERGGNRGNWY